MLMRAIKIGIAIVMVFAMLANTVLATAYDGVADSLSQSEIQPRLEETTWVYREINGVMHMRLWSLTRGIWLTDWIVV